jgi:hypothetical protein
LLLLLLLHTVKRIPSLLLFFSVWLLQLLLRASWLSFACIVRHTVDAAAAAADTMNRMAKGRIEYLSPLHLSSLSLSHSASFSFSSAAALHFVFLLQTLERARETLLHLLLSHFRIR